MEGKIPLNLKLRKAEHKKIAYVQDVLVEELYNFFPNAIIHGGTAIWRCYNGNRFSEDIDAYLPRDVEKIKGFFELLKSKGFKIIKSRIKENSVYSEVVFNNVPVRFEATFQVKKGTTMKYEKSEGFFINVFTLTAEELVLEKVEAYLKRRKIRDIYDIFFLLNYAEREKIQKAVMKLINNFEKPKDEESLALIIISGAVPNSEQLLRGLERWAR